MPLKSANERPPTTLEMPPMKVTATNATFNKTKAARAALGQCVKLRRHQTRAERRCSSASTRDSSVSGARRGGMSRNASVITCSSFSSLR